VAVVSDEAVEKLATALATAYLPNEGGRLWIFAPGGLVTKATVGPVEQAGKGSLWIEPAEDQP